MPAASTATRGHPSSQVKPPSQIDSTTNKHLLAYTREHMSNANSITFKRIGEFDDSQLLIITRTIDAIMCNGWDDDDTQMIVKQHFPNLLKMRRKEHALIYMLRELCDSLANDQQSHYETVLCNTLRKMDGVLNNPDARSKLDWDYLFPIMKEGFSQMCIAVVYYEISIMSRDNIPAYLISMLCTRVSDHYLTVFKCFPVRYGANCRNIYTCIQIACDEQALELTNNNRLSINLPFDAGLEYAITGIKRAKYITALTIANMIVYLGEIKRILHVMPDITYAADHLDSMRSTCLDAIIQSIAAISENRITNRCLNQALKSLKKLLSEYRSYFTDLQGGFPLMNRLRREGYTQPGKLNREVQHLLYTWCTCIFANYLYRITVCMTDNNQRGIVIYRKKFNDTFGRDMLMSEISHQLTELLQCYHEQCRLLGKQISDCDQFMHNPVAPLRIAKFTSEQFSKAMYTYSLSFLDNDFVDDFTKPINDIPSGAPLRSAYKLYESQAVVIPMMRHLYTKRYRNAIIHRHIISDMIMLMHALTTLTDAINASAARITTRVKLYRTRCRTADNMKTNTTTVNTITDTAVAVTPVPQKTNKHAAATTTAADGDTLSSTFIIN